MKEVQHCYVCGGAGYLAAGPIALSDDEWEGPPSIGQCPRCHRFICSDHAEPLDLARAEQRGGLFRKRGATGPRTLCCPFDRGVPLGVDAG